MSKLNIKDFCIDPSAKSSNLSFVKLFGPIKDIAFNLEKPFGDEVYVVLTGILLQDGTKLEVEGEHDCPYLVSYTANPPANFEDEVLEDLYKQEKEDEDVDG